jgi:hypothetical protein
MALAFLTPVRLSNEQSDPAELIFSITPLAHLQCEAFPPRRLHKDMEEAPSMGSTNSGR